MTNSSDVEGHVQTLVAAPATLETWSKEAWKDGIQINQAKPLDRLLVQTMHSTYEITVIDPDTAQVMIRGGEFFPEPTAAHISGASLHSSFLKLRGIYLGFRLEILVDDKRVTTSRVRRIII